MKIVTNVEINFSLSELKKMVTEYNRNIFCENKKEIDRIIQENICSEFPKDISISIHDLENPFFLFLDSTDKHDMELLVKEHVACLLSIEQIRIIENAKSGKINVYEDPAYGEDDYQKILFSVDFNDLDF